ncbi:MAG: tRNA preQ1(34) S-adenosylmethionine ribosyltransferase-isomerase QueA [Armatimonadetes bacterium]|nr:tRNA preQ1(34) S-adenosylmethionine ribosyltransferase-isomerase QueA [Armatimonadota bacterium]
MRLEDFDYSLPREAIAQEPISPRDASRLLALDRARPGLEHRRFSDLVDYLHEGDLLVFNDTRVLPARLRGVKPTGARVEFLLLRPLEPPLWEALVHPGRRMGPGAEVLFGEGAIRGRVVDRLPGGGRIVSLETEGEIEAAIHRWGEIPLPPYIETALSDPERYQTVYSRQTGSAAAPTAGLHFTPELLAALAQKGIRTAFITLHVGIGTFQPVRCEEIEKHVMHEEYIQVPSSTARAVAEAKGRVVAVGTTSVRALESAATGPRTLEPFAGKVGLYIRPGYRFQVVDALITNFHYPRSSLLIMVSALAGRERILSAYREALSAGYRFLSFGDAMLIV